MNHLPVDKTTKRVRETKEEIKEQLEELSISDKNKNTDIVGMGSWWWYSGQTPLFLLALSKKLRKTAHFDHIRHENDFQFSTYFSTCSKFKK